MIHRNFRAEALLRLPVNGVYRMWSGCTDRRLKGQVTVTTQITFPGGEVSLGDQVCPRFQGASLAEPPLGGRAGNAGPQYGMIRRDVRAEALQRIVRKRKSQRMEGCTSRRPMPT